LRVRLYEGRARRPPARLLVLRRGDLLARVGADVDAVGDVVVRGLLPMAVAAVVGLGASVAMGLFLPAAGLALAGALLLAGVVAPWWAQRTARVVERDSARARAELAAVTQTLLDGAGELTVAGRVEPALADLRGADAALARATDRGAGPLAVSAALLPAAIGVGMLSALVLGIPAVTAGELAAVELAVITLVPLAVFEASSVLPAAAVAVHRSREAARRVVELIEAPDADGPGATVAPATTAAAEPAPGASPALVAHGLACGWPDGPTLLPRLDLELAAGRSLAVVGPSGLGKTTLLLTLAGLLPPKAGTVHVGGLDVHRLDRARASSHVALTTEDAHVFDTTVLENLRVARGDVTPEEASAALHAVGLGAWLDHLPSGLQTVLGSDAARVSGGERRRLLIARALLSRAPVLLLDEPTEHVDASGRELLTALLDGTLTGSRAVVVVTHRLAGLEASSEVILLDRTGSVRARGEHRALLEGPDAVPLYQAAWRAEQEDDG
ncbi:MAG TPA: thiol reductant ABC exporter subunit CydC, partial [Actinotalea sp.]|nr:thiol reductant ABC exporter subunit CydC [Actinotalea sp.]